ncbi:nuclear transport factor 2 family protein [Nocardioides yefusunii]|uniref:Nuclear transport factor 2 family protein n=1 Tax=Nocardioides yefusunii TaxID=2500546 RepID=A0ABW1QW49_9ACTN|nr:nuclear transport factor 2 family protein [Nocardioides yefusunii]
MSDFVTRLERYYATIDSGDLDGGVALLAPDVRFAILLPGTPVRGESRDGVKAYLEGRPAGVRRVHVPQHRSTDGDLEFVYGAVVENDERTTGHFLASARIGADGLIRGYQVAFDPDLGLTALD